MFRSLVTRGRPAHALVPRINSDIADRNRSAYSTATSVSLTLLGTDAHASTVITDLAFLPQNSEGGSGDFQKVVLGPELLKTNMKQLKTLMFPTPNELGEWDGESDEARLRANNNRVGADEGQLAKLVGRSIEAPFETSESETGRRRIKTPITDLTARQADLSMALRKAVAPAVGGRLIPANKSENGGVKLQNGFLKTEELQETLNSLKAIAVEMRLIKNPSASLKERIAAIDTLVSGFEGLIKLKDVLHVPEDGQRPPDLDVLGNRLRTVV